MRAIIIAGVAHIICGDLDEAVRLFRKVIRLNPMDAGTAYLGLSHVAMCRGDYEASADWATRALSMIPDFGVAHWMLIAANAYLGRMDAARAALAAYLATAPGVTIATIRNGARAKDPMRMTVFLDGLRAAGMPEG